MEAKKKGAVEEVCIGGPIFLLKDLHSLLQHDACKQAQLHASLDKVQGPPLIRVAGRRTTAGKE